ncbi:MAG: SpvB/TcaC N-terminal domain-containing protein [Bryobacteraceae bacterium]
MQEILAGRADRVGPTAGPYSATPQITLPKGGGAIRGVDEKFAINPATGSGSMRIPLALSAGRSGFGPHLSLKYDSGAGNGIFGMGWTMPTPSIVRRTDKGLPQYRDSEESDIFVLSDAEDLVPVLAARGRDEYEREGYRVAPYRPRIEGLFARIERWTSIETGETHWRSISRDNVLTFYGLDADSRIADPDSPGHVFEWLMCRSYDDRGNASVYEYVAENDRGVDLTKPSECRRARTANRYLKRIRYGNQRPLRCRRLEAIDDEAVQWAFEVVFDYGNDWPVRCDPFSSYRSGFEIRTHRLCRRVLMYHHFPEELGASPCLVRSTTFQYREKAVGALLERVVQSGHRRRKDGEQVTRSLPPLDLFYTESALEAPERFEFRVEEADHASVANLPGSVDGENYRWVDLDGEGIAGVLTEQNEAWFYKPNLGRGQLGAVETIGKQPSLAALNSGSQHLMDVAGDGNLDLVELSVSAPGFYERTFDAGWEGFRTFRSLPVQDWSDPNLRFLDLTGDGVADVLITEDDAFTWHPSLRKEGFGAGIRVPVPLEEERGPRVMFADGIQSIHLADMTGDGLADLVRIRNGDVCYWPNRGYGRFGAKVTMDDAPWFDEPDLFDIRRIRLGDTDGSGTADLLYFGADGIKIYLNQAGNGWSAVRHLRAFPAVDNVASVTVADFLGRGTACVVWSSPWPADARRQLRYLDLMCGRKPHLLEHAVNHLGAEMRIGYASSTQFYLADKEAGRPWVTRLPFPVHVVERVEKYDRVSRNRFVTRYSYHHGFYDGVDREFRGFGRVDQYDTEKFEAVNSDAASTVPPVLTRTWFHTGVFLRGRRISRHLEHEYFHEDRELLLDDTVLPEHVTSEEAREACRSLKGSLLRREIYALDGKEESGRPYEVTESNLAVRLLQRRGPNRHAVFFTHTREQLDLRYERKLEPRVSHTMTLAVDEYGNVRQAVSIGYGRRFADASPLLTDEDREKQARTLVTVTETDYTNAVEEADGHRTPLTAERRTHELLNAVPGAARLFRFHELAARVVQAADGMHDLRFADWEAAGAVEDAPYRRLLNKRRSYYRSDDLERVLTLGELQLLALPGQDYQLAFPDGLLEEVYRLADSEKVLSREGGYVQIEGSGEWWAPSGRVFYAPEQCGAAEELAHAVRHFFIPRCFRDPFGNAGTVVYDAHDLFPVETADAAGNVTRAEMDYCVLAPRRVTDANGNRSEIAFDALGLVAGLAVMGKASERAGDTLDGFEPDLTPWQLEAFLGDPHGLAGNLLGGATIRTVYDVERYLRSEKPVFAAMISRETHVSDLEPGEQSRMQLSLSYSDGFGREIQKKIQAAPGAGMNPRWIGSGWTIFNNKGLPVREYEPFFSASQDFEFAAVTGVSPILFYDPVGRAVAVLYPNHTFEKAAFDPWRQANFDVDDTVTFDPRTDPDAGEFFARLNESEYLPTWYRQRIDGGEGPSERAAAQKAARHAGTPTVAYLDSLGRTFLTVADNGAETFQTRMVLDIESNQRAVVDPLGRTVARRDFDMLGRQIRQSSMEAGERTMLSDVAGRPIRAWNSRRYVFRNEYDELRRPTRAFVQGGDAHERNASPFPCEVLFQRTVYGDSAECGLSEQRRREANLRGRVYRTFDTAGVVGMDRYDFKGNLLETSRRFLQNYKTAADWSCPPALGAATFPSSARYDALNRVVTSSSPDGSAFRPAYDEGNLLRKLDVALRGAARDGRLAWTEFVSSIEYNAKGQRLRIEYGNGATTSYEHDPETFRLFRLRTTRPPVHDATAAEIFADSAVVQDLRYTYDPIGNITELADASLRTVFHDNQKVEAVARYTYDAVYRLIEAGGRERASHSGFAFEPAGGNYRDYPFAAAPRLPDAQALRNYVERYQYDAVGNFERVIHGGGLNSWTRTYTYAEESQLEPGTLSNRLSSARLKNAEERYLYDVHGNVVQMPHLPAMRWDFLDRLCATSAQVVNCGTPETTFYVYDGSGQRVRKVTELQSGARKNERIYAGGFEIFREYDGNGETVRLERETLHVMDDRQRIALVETVTADCRDAFLSHEPVLRYQFGNHLASASVELDAAAELISYEEYAPYGDTVYQAGRSAAEVSLKRYRYTGKERDEENGFTYHGARYCAPWLGRWTSTDPSGVQDSTNLYLYAKANPLTYSDPSGGDAQSEATYDKLVNSDDPRERAWAIPENGTGSTGSSSVPTPSLSGPARISSTSPSNSTPAPSAPKPKPKAEAPKMSDAESMENLKAVVERLQPTYTYSPTVTRAMGAAQAAGGLLEGAGALYAEPESLGASTIVLLNAADTVQSGVRMLVTGKSVPSFKYELSAGIATGLGADPKTANAFGVLADVSGNAAAMGASAKMATAPIRLNEPPSLGGGGFGGGTPPPRNPFAGLTAEEIDQSIAELGVTQHYRVPIAVTEAGHAPESLVPVSRWGQSGLRPGDWIMVGDPTFWTYLKSFKWEPFGKWVRNIPGLNRLKLNEPAPWLSGQTFMVPPGSIRVPEGVGAEGAIKGMYGQRKYVFP